MTVGLKYNGLRVSETALQSRIPLGVGYPADRIKVQLKWIMENCTDINDLDCENVLEGLWYDSIGIYNNNIEKAIHEAVEELVEAGKIERW